MEKVRIYHNPNCGTSRNVLAIIRHCGIEPEIIYYLKTPPSRMELVELLLEMKLSARELLRTDVPAYEKFNLESSSVTDEEMIDAMIQDPILINRPIVVTSKGAKLCRPCEAILTILPVKMEKDFVKEDGQIIQSL
ncbi:TPA: arsenate reductase (glutaredoxin) [Streptococcus agalactiae]